MTGKEWEEGRASGVSTCKTVRLCSMGMHTYQDKDGCSESKVRKCPSGGQLALSTLSCCTFPLSHRIPNTVFIKFTLCSPYTDHVIMYFLVLPLGATDDLTDLQGPNNPFH